MGLFNLTPQQVRDSARMQNRQQASQFGGWGMLGNFIGEKIGTKPRMQGTVDYQSKIMSIKQNVISQPGFKALKPAQKISALSNAYINAGEVDLATQLMQQARTFAPTGNKEKSALLKQHRTEVSKVTKDMRTIDAAYSKIKKNATENTATGDMGMIFGIMKLLDPNSTVREGEYATAQQAGSVPTRILNFYNSSVEGTKLTGPQRAEFMSTAGNLYQGQRESTDRSIENILQLSDVDQIPRGEVLGAGRHKAYKKRQKPSGLTPAEQKELEALEKEFGTP